MPLIIDCILDMKFKESGSAPKRSKKSKVNRKPPFKIKVVDLNNDNASGECAESAPEVQNVPRKERKFIKKEKTKPKINLMVTDDDELNSFRENDFSDGGGSDVDNDGDYENFMEEMAKIDGKKKKILSNRVEGTGEVSEYNLSARRTTKVDTSGLVSALEENSEVPEDVRQLSKVNYVVE